MQPSGTPDPLQSILDSLDAIVYVADMETHEVLYVNQFTRDLFGSIEGQRCWQVIQTGQAGPCTFCTNPQLLDADGKPTGPISWRFQNTANHRWYDIRDRAMRWSDGRLVRLEIATDITDRMEAEQKAQRTNELMTVISRAQAHFIAEADPGAVFESLLEDILQVTESEYGFIGDVEIVEGQVTCLRTRAITNIAWSRATQSFYEAGAREGLVFTNLDTLFGAVLRSEEPVISNDPASDPRAGGLPPGHPPLGAFLGMPLHSGGEFVGMVGLANRPGGYDEGLLEELRPLQHTCAGIVLSLRHQEQRPAARQEIETHSEFVSTILESISSPIYVINPTTRDIEMANSAAGVDLTEGPVTCHAATHRRDRPCNEEGDPCPLDKVLATKEMASTEHQHLDPDGQLRTFEISQYPVLNREGEVVKVIEYALDITTRREQDRRMHESKRLESLGRLAGGVAHDFNNLLMAIMGYGDLLHLKLALDDPLQEDVNAIIAASERARSLTRQLLIFSRRQAMEMKPIDLGVITESLGRMLLRLISEDIELVMKVSSPTWNVQADQGQIEQVIMNLVVNARDAMPDGGKLVVEVGDVEVGPGLAVDHPDVSAGSYVGITVTDSGVGMEEATRARVFEPFFTTKDVDKGTGLGLSMVYGIVAQHGGHIHLESEPGQGSSFRVLLPASTRPVEERERGQTCSTAPSAGTVLVVDDEVAVRSVIASSLERLGYEVFVAARGQDAIELSRRHPRPIDILITDVVMPGLYGPEVAREIRQQRPAIKVVYVTGYAEAGHLAGTEEEGHTVLHKPFRPSELAEKLKELEP